jgi:ATP-dependent Clp protease ATP-binding subunit ClpA
MDHGTLTDNNGKSADFRHVVLIMTSNVGVRDMARRPLGFGDATASPDVDKEFKRLFAPEFRNRLDARVQFKPLDRKVMGAIVRKFLRETEDLLRDKHITLEASPAAVEWLSTEGYDEAFGARPLARVVQQHVRQPLSEEILFGELTGGGSVTLDAQDGKLVLRSKPAEKPAEATAEASAEKPADATPQSDKGPDDHNNKKLN